MMTLVTLKWSKWAPTIAGEMTLPLHCTLAVVRL